MTISNLEKYEYIAVFNKLSIQSIKKLNKDNYN